jgi:ribose/xylose/arabinose/galactoside ABC-type transport system permease subunit
MSRKSSDRLKDTTKIKFFSLVPVNCYTVAYIFFSPFITTFITQYIYVLLLKYQKVNETFSGYTVNMSKFINSRIKEFRKEFRSMTNFFEGKTLNQFPILLFFIVFLATMLTMAYLYLNVIK